MHRVIAAEHRPDGVVDELLLGGLAGEFPRLLHLLLAPAESQVLLPHHLFAGLAQFVDALADAALRHQVVGAGLLRPLLVLLAILVHRGGQVVAAHVGHGPGESVSGWLAAIGLWNGCGRSLLRGGEGVGGGYE